jgi:hypothetical protein
MSMRPVPSLKDLADTVGSAGREYWSRKIKLLVVPTSKAIEELQHPRDTNDTNVILHVTCGTPFRRPRMKSAPKAARR